MSNHLPEDNDAISRAMIKVIVALAAILLAIVGCQRLNAEPLKQTAPVDNGIRSCELVRIIDGDTVVLTVNLGDGVSLTNRHIRLSNVYVDEKGTVDGDNATDCLNKLLKAHAGEPMVIQLNGRDKYGRALGTVWVGDCNLNDEQRKLPQKGRGIK